MRMMCADEDETVANTAMSAIYDRNAPRRATNLLLNEDLLMQAKWVTKNLSATVEELLAGYLQEEQLRRRAEDEAQDQVISALNDFHTCMDSYRTSSRHFKSLKTL